MPTESHIWVNNGISLSVLVTVTFIVIILFRALFFVKLYSATVEINSVSIFSLNSHQLYHDHNIFNIVQVSANLVEGGVRLVWLHQLGMQPWAGRQGKGGHQSHPGSDSPPSRGHAHNCSPINPGLLYYFQIIFKWLKSLRSHLISPVLQWSLLYLVRVGKAERLSGS